jgi:hypothetical protein
MMCSSELANSIIADTVGQVIFRKKRSDLICILKLPVSAVDLQRNFEFSGEIVEDS